MPFTFIAYTYRAHVFDGMYVERTFMWTNLYFTELPTTTHKSIQNFNAF